MKSINADVGFKHPYKICMYEWWDVSNWSHFLWQLTSLSILHVTMEGAFWHMDASVVEDNITNFLADVPPGLVFSLA